MRGDDGESSVVDWRFVVDESEVAIVVGDNADGAGHAKEWWCTGCEGKRVQHGSLRQACGD